MHLLIIINLREGTVSILDELLLVWIGNVALNASSAIHENLLVHLIHNIKKAKASCKQFVDTISDMETQVCLLTVCSLLILAK